MRRWKFYKNWHLWSMATIIQWRIVVLNWLNQWVNKPLLISHGTPFWQSPLFSHSSHKIDSLWSRRWWKDLQYRFTWLQLPPWNVTASCFMAVNYKFYCEIRKDSEGMRNDIAKNQWGKRLRDSWIALSNYHFQKYGSVIWKAGLVGNLGVGLIGP